MHVVDDIAHCAGVLLEAAPVIERHDQNDEQQHEGEDDERHDASCRADLLVAVLELKLGVARLEVLNVIFYLQLAVSLGSLEVVELLEDGGVLFQGLDLGGVVADIFGGIYQELYELLAYGGALGLGEYLLQERDCGGVVARGHGVERPVLGQFLHVVAYVRACGGELHNLRVDAVDLASAQTLVVPHHAA